MLVLIGVSAIINLDKSACGEQGGAFFFRQPTTGKMHYCLDPPSLVGYCINYIQLPYSTIIFVGDWHEILYTQGPSTAGCALHAHWLILWPYLANSTNLGHLSPLFEAMGQIIVGMDCSWHLSIFGDHSDRSPAHPVVWYFMIYFMQVLSPTKTTPETIKGMLIWVAF